MLLPMKILLLFLALTLVPSCKDPQVPPPPTGDDCKAAEANLEKLAREQGCKNGLGQPLGSPNSKGESYASICERVEREGKVSMRSSCVAQAKTCEEERSCQSQ